MEKFKLDHKFVESLPNPLENGILYISIPFRIIAHNCCCGCGKKVVLNLSPYEGWEFTYNGKTISIYPSIGNYGLKCQSHYFITKSVVEWVPRWNDDRFKRKNKKRFSQFWKR